ncbi:MAG: NADH-quinone oxidoreductase subunit N [Cyclobacteriaceae bacterium]|nr:NADH-quinone oxidoreductase subunit N [Cyclobacteriaceae bacterium]
MSFSDFLLMRNELLLVAAAVIILIADMSFSDENKRGLYNISLLTMIIITVLGFLPAPSGKLFGGMYITGDIYILMKNILNIATVIVLLQSRGWLEKPGQQKRMGEFILLLVSVLIGMSYMISSGHFIMFYLGMELATIPLAALAAYELNKSKSAEAGIKLILLAAFSSGILLFGTSLIYAAAGTLYFEGVMAILDSTAFTTLGLILFFAGLGFKISLVPFHLWTADVYEGAPTNVTSFLSVASKGAAVFILVIILNTVFKSLNDVWDPMVYALIIITITIGNLFALRQRNIKRFLAFSSIAQAGFIMLGVINDGGLGMATVIYFVLVYVFSNLAAFGVAAAIENETGKESIDDYNGFYRTNPRLSLVMMLAMFSLAGIPPFAGFFGKFFLFTAAAEKGYYILTLIAVLNTIISLYYYLLVIKAMFIDKNGAPIGYFKSDTAMQVSLVICILGIIVTGFTSGVFDYMVNLSQQFFLTLQ